LKAHTDAGKACVGIRAVLAFWVDDSDGVGQFLLALMMVGDDYIHTELFCIQGFLKRRDAAVNRNDKLDAVGRQELQRGPVNAVAFIDPPGNIYLVFHTF
jgi:hypothetical protein